MATDGRRACMIFCAHTEFLIGLRRSCRVTAGLETRGNGGGDLRGRIDDDDAGGFQRLAFGGVAAGIAGDDRAGMPHFLAGRRGRAGNEGDHRLAHRCRVLGRVFLHRAADLADDDDGLGAGVLIERLSASRVVVPSIGSPPMPMKADWPSPARVRLRQTSVPRLPLREITPTPPGLEHARHEGRHDADEAFAGRDEARGVGADDAGAVLRGRGDASPSRPAPGCARSARPAA